MKILLLLLVLILTFVNANEVERIESIVKDINKLREDYNKLDDELTICHYDLNDEKERKKILIQEIKSLKNTLKKTKIQLKTKEKYIKNLNMNKNKKVKTQIIVQKCLENKDTKEENSFPKLQMKEAYKVEDNFQAIYFQASAFRVNKEADIYDGVDGNIVDTWEEKTSFTSNQKMQGWVKITGYFVDQVWQPSKEELWVKESDTFKRD